MPKKRNEAPVVPVHKALDEKINALLAKYSPDNPPVIPEGHDMHLEIAAQALGMTYSAAHKKFVNRNPGVRSVRANVKRKMFSIMYAGGIGL